MSVHFHVLFVHRIDFRASPPLTTGELPVH